MTTTTDERERHCGNCVNASFDERWYSSYTPAGYDFSCNVDAHPGRGKRMNVFSYESPVVDDELLYALRCPRFEEGESYIEREDPPEDD